MAPLVLGKGSNIGAVVNALGLGRTLIIVYISMLAVCMQERAGGSV